MPTDAPAPQDSPTPPSHVPSSTGPNPQCAILKAQIAGYIQLDEQKKTDLIAKAKAIYADFASRGMIGSSAYLYAMAANKAAYQAVVKDEAHWKNYSIPGC